VLEVISRAEGNGRKETGRRVRLRIEQVLNAARARGLRRRDSINPADQKLIAAVRPTKRKGERPHYRAVKIGDAPRVFQALKAGASTRSALAAWCFMVLTASRPSEALQAKWLEIDLDERLWTVPAERMKSAVEHVVPLCSAALEVLELQARVRTGDAVFPGLSGSPLCYDAFAYAPARARPRIDAATPHGWRSVFRSWAGNVAEDVPRDLAEAALAHSGRGRRRILARFPCGRAAPQGDGDV
jgi:integrase